ACAADKKTIKVAAEAYMAQKGNYPADTNTMVTAGLLRDVSTIWTYAISGSDFILTGQGDCLVTTPTTVAP
ncbi:MAG TPA: hypothetical protein PLB21_15770, partial [Actinomycetota bacterium]|nr:hypothetical protein [Actinomycetota bacterium]